MPDESDPPIFTKRQLIQSLGQFLVVFLTGLGAHATLKELTWDVAYSSGIQAALSMLLILGFSKVGPK